MSWYVMSDSYVLTFINWVSGASEDSELVMYVQSFLNHSLCPHPCVWTLVISTTEISAFTTFSTASECMSSHYFLQVFCTW